MARGREGETDRQTDRQTERHRHRPREERVWERFYLALIIEFPLTCCCSCIHNSIYLTLWHAWSPAECSVCERPDLMIFMLTYALLDVLDLWLELESSQYISSAASSSALATCTIQPLCEIRNPIDKSILTTRIFIAEVLHILQQILILTRRCLRRSFSWLAECRHNVLKIS